MRTRPLAHARTVGAGGWLWAGTLLTAPVAGVAAHAAVSPVLKFLTALAAIALSAAVMTRTVDQLGQRLRASAVGIFQAVTGNLPELIIGIFALRQGLVTVVQATLIGSVLSLLLFGNGLAFVVGGLRHGPLGIDANRAQVTRVTLVLMVATLVAPAVAVNLHAAAAAHTHAVSYVCAAALLTVFALALPSKIRGEGGDASAAVGEAVSTLQPGPAAPLPRTLTLLGIAGLLTAVEADWLTADLAPAITALHLNPGFVGLFIVAIVGNLSQFAPAVRLAARGDADTATAINMEGALQVALMLAPLLVVIAPLTGATAFTLIFPPLQVVAVILAVVLVVFVTIDGKINHMEGVMLIALYAVLGSLFWWS